MNPLTALFAAGAFVTLRDQKEAAQQRDELRREIRQRDVHNDDKPITMDDPDRELQLDQSDALDRLVEIRSKNEPIPESRDATQDGTITLDPGQKAIIEMSPEQGYVNRIERVYADRRDDHSYDIEIGGVSVSSLHEWDGNPSRRVSENEKVVFEISNNSSGTTTMDWVIEAYGYDSESEPRGI